MGAGLPNYPWIRTCNILVEKTLKASAIVYCVRTGSSVTASQTIIGEVLWSNVVFHVVFVLRAQNGRVVIMLTLA